MNAFFVTMVLVVIWLFAHNIMLYGSLQFLRRVMGATGEVDAYRRKYLALLLEGGPATQAERKLGSGRRCCFFVESKGGHRVVVLTISGTRLVLDTRQVKIRDCYDSAGRSLPFRLDGGELHVLVGDQVYNYGPWGGIPRQDSMELPHV